MSEELQKEIDRLKAENSKLARDLAGAHEDLKETRTEAKDRRLAGNKLTEQLDALTKERDGYKVKAEADPEGLKAQVSDLSGKLRDVAHRAAFTKVAQGLKVSDPTKVADLYALSGYKAEDDQPDEKKIAEVVTTALKGRGHYLDAAADAAKGGPGGASGATTTQPGRPGVGAERGQSVQSESKSTPAATNGIWRL